jgi:hypothetical protein
MMRIIIKVIGHKIDAISIINNLIKIIKIKINKI